MASSPASGRPGGLDVKVNRDARVICLTRAARAMPDRADRGGSRLDN
jgi:hypothetical protein